MPAPAPIPMPMPASTGPAPTLTPMPYTGPSRRYKRGLPNATMIFMLLVVLISNEALMVRFKSRSCHSQTHPTKLIRTQFTTTPIASLARRSTHVSSMVGSLTRGTYLYNPRHSPGARPRRNPSPSHGLRIRPRSQRPSPTVR